MGTRLATLGSRAFRPALVVHATALAVIGAAGGTWVARALRVAAIALVAAAAWWVETSRPAPARRLRWLWLVIVTATTADAATVGFAHTRVDGASVRGVAGIVALVAGLVLLTALAGSLLGRTRRWRRLWALPVGLALLAFVVEPVVVAVYATAQPPARLGSVTPSDLGLPYDDVTFLTPDGVTLSGWYLPTQQGAAVVLLHGASSTRTSVLDQAAVLHRHGYGVLLFDARGHGRSEGSPMDLGWYGDLDVRGAVDLLATLEGVDPGRIGIVGMSMGGEEAIGAAAADRRLRAVVAEGASNRTATDRGHWLPGGVNGWIQRRIDEVTFGLTDLLTPASPPISLREAARRTAPRPILLIAGEGEVDAARSIQRGSPATVAIWESGAGHTRALDEHPTEWAARVLEFLDTHLS